MATGHASPMQHDNDTPVWDRLTRRQIVLTFAGVMMALFLASLDQTIVGTAMPRIIGDLGGFDRYTWVTTAYLVTSTTVVPLVGRFSDMYGRKWFFVAGIVIFLIGSALSGLSQTMTQLIIFRGFQGIGGGAMMANAFVAIGDLFPPAERGKYQGLTAGVFGLSSIIGPALGGFLTDSLSWHWIFYVNLPLGIPAVALFAMFYPYVRPLGEGRRQIDYIGATLLILAVVPLLLALSWGGVQYSWSSGEVIGLLIFSAVAAALFIFTELRTAEPIMPLGIFRNSIVSISMIAIFLTGFGMFGAIIFVPLFFQGVLGASATSSGSFLTPMMLGMVISGAVSGMLLSRAGGHYRIQGVIGLAVMSAGMFLLSRLTVGTSYWEAVADIVLVGLGLGATFPIFTIAVQNAVSYRVMGVATSTTQFVRSMGGTLGLAALGALMTTRFASAFTASVPSALRQALPPEQLAALGKNPQALVSPEAQQQLQAALAHLGPQAGAVMDQLLTTIKAALASAIADIYIVAFVVTLAAVVVTAFIKEIPLQRGQRAVAIAPEAAEEAPSVSGASE